MEFRIIAHLHNFFNDYRSSCRLFITKKIRTIQDLERHIASTFQISKDFYLIASNLYLPGSEDIRILKEDDSVAVIPYGIRKSHNTVTTSELENVKPSKHKVPASSIEIETWEEESCKKLKRKRKRNESQSEIINSAFITDDKTKKKKSKICFTNEQELVYKTSINAEGEASKKKKKKKTKSKPDLENESKLDMPIKEKNNETKSWKSELNTNFTQLNGIRSEDSSDDSDIGDGINEKMKIKERKNTLGIDTPKSTCKFNYINELNSVKKKPIELLPISSKAKVIKSIIVYDTPQIEETKKEIQPILNSNQNGISSENHEDTSTKQPLIVPESKTSPENKVATNEVNKKDEHNALTTNQCEDMDCLQEIKTDEQIMKMDSFEEINTCKQIPNTFINEVFSSTQNEITNDDLSTISATPSEAVSLLTDANDTDLSQSLQKNKPKRKRVRRHKKKPPSNELGSLEIPVVASMKPLVTQAAPILHIRFEDDQNSAVNEENAEVTITLTADEIDYEKLCTEEIVQFPIMQNMFPKKGDLIAFKVYMLSKSYNPEISSFIIGRVLNFCLEKQSIVFELLVGSDQCNSPNGKFSLEDLEECDNTEEVEKEFLWKELIEPRLLFP